MKKKNLISVVVTTKNEEKVLGRLLQSVKGQKDASKEIIVVDNRSRDNTLGIAKKFTRKVYTYGPERSAQRNFGAKKASGEYLLFLDADMELTENVLSECVKKIEGNKEIGGIVIPEESLASNFWERVKAYERSFYNESGDATTDAARFFRKSTFNKAGGYDELITGPEDWELPESVGKMGYKIDRVRSVIYHYERIPSLYSLVRKKFYYAKLAHKYLKKQNIPLVSSKTIYFLRPVFYKKWRKLVSNPLLSIAMFYMFGCEMAGGLVGYVRGRLDEG
ncbi:MAG TPA: glycosyltransferase [Patescibacteria group bacterium]